MQPQVMGWTIRFGNIATILAQVIVSFGVNRKVVRDFCSCVGSCGFDSVNSFIFFKESILSLLWHLRSSVENILIVMIY
jgi:hypothetical protein